MTTTTTASPWPYVVAFCVALLTALGGFAILTLAPSDRVDHAIGKIGQGLALILADPRGFVASVVTLLGVAVGIAAGAKALHLTQPPKSGGGSGGVTLLALAFLGASTLTGCGASALSMQARAATIVGVGLGGIGAEVHTQRDAAMTACDADDACESTTASAWAPAVAAYESARAALTTWIESLSVAQAAGADDGDVLGALLVAVARLAREWNALAAALRGVGVDVPDLPASVSGLLAVAS